MTSPHDAPTMRSLRSLLVLSLLGALLGACGGGKQKPGASHPATLEEMFATPTQVAVLPRPLGAVRLGMAIEDVYAAAPALDKMNIYTPPKLPAVKVMLITHGKGHLEEVDSQLPADAAATLLRSWGPPQRRQPSSSGERMLWVNAEQSMEVMWLPALSLLFFGKLGTVSPLMPSSP